MNDANPTSHAIRVEPYDDYFFEGMGRQNMSFHHALAELIDNSIAASEFPFEVDVYLASDEPGEIAVKVVDKGSGIGITDLIERALKLGGRPTSTNRLNEHGFGLKNSLCSFTGNSTPFLIQTRDQAALEAGAYYEVAGPFQRDMVAAEQPTSGWPPDGSDASGTIVSLVTSLGYLQGIQQTRGPRATNMATLTGYLLEHLGVMYRGYLSTIVPGTTNVQGQIRIHQGGDTHHVEPLLVPMDGIQRVELPFTAGGSNYVAEYRHGVLDETLRDNAGFSLYYQANIPTQGIDVRIGGRTIATRQLSEIWDRDRHNNFNSFVGELVIPADVPREFLRSVNNKSAYDVNDDIWASLFHDLNANHPPPREARAQTERELRDLLAHNFQTYSEDQIVKEYAVWASAVKIDIYRKNPATGAITLYETKIGQAQPIFLYQLRMYWDGLALAGEQPTKAILVAADFQDVHSQMASQLNQLQDPNGNTYNFEIKRIQDFPL